jgi:hypothetical protein
MRPLQAQSAFAFTRDFVGASIELNPGGFCEAASKGDMAQPLADQSDVFGHQVGARICNGLGIMRACLETQKLEQLEARMDEIADRVARDRTNAARERTSTHEAQRLTN